MTEQERHKERIKFFGTHIDPLTMKETLQRITEIIDKRETTQHVVINVAKLVMLQDNRELRDVINSCSLINADGAGIVWGARFLGHSIPERVAGIDLMQELVDLAAQKGYRVYFLGAMKDVVKQAIEAFAVRQSFLQVAGYHDGYFSKEEESEIVEQIKNSNADILFVGIPSPKKELFLNKYLKEMNVPFVMGVGGSFDVVAGRMRRAPLWMQKSGLEWFYRFLQEPARMWKRYLVTNLRYLGMLIKTKVGLCCNK